MFLSSGGGKAITILHDGNVGIGTDDPQSKLQIESTGEALRFTRSGQETYRIIHGTSGLYFTEPDAGDLMFGVTQNSDFDIFDTSGNVMFRADGSASKVGIGTTTPDAKLEVSGGIIAGGKITYTISSGSLTTTGTAVAGLNTGGNGGSAGFIFTCFGGNGYQRIVYSCRNESGTWNIDKDIDEGVNAFDVTYAADGSDNITFTFKARSSTQSYTPRVTVEATGSYINKSYIN
jgi:hypothetical protein